jgi:hypothetical protein
MRRTALILPVALLALSLTACGDARLRKLSAGIDKDSVAVVMGGDAPTQSASYLTSGTYWELHLYARGEAPEGDTLTWRAMSPVVFRDGKVSGWGWKYWEGEAALNGIPVPPKE